MESISNRVNSLSPSATIAMNQKSRDLTAKGINVINLSVGEPDFFTPDHIKAAAKKAIDDNFSFYPPVAGFPDLKKAISEKFKGKITWIIHPNRCWFHAEPSIHLPMHL